MPINKPMMKAMKKEYGAKKGEKVYYAVEMKKKEEKKRGSPHDRMVEKAAGIKMPASHKKMTPAQHKKAMSKMKK